MKILFLVMESRRASLDHLYESIAAHTDCDLRRLSKTEQKNLRRYFHKNVEVDRYERIVLLLSPKRLLQQPLFLRSIPNLVSIELDACLNYFPCEFQGKYSAHFRRLPAMRVLSSGFQITNKFLSEGVDASFFSKGYDQVLLRNLGGVRDIELGFIGHIKPDAYRGRRAMLEAVKEHEPELKVLFTESGNDYLMMLNRIRFFICPDIGFDEYMLKNFESMACGCVLCTYDQGEEENRALGFVDMENLVLFRDVDELLKKLQCLRADPAMADRIAAAGQALVEREHTHAHVGERIVEALRPSLRPNPTPGLLERLRLALRL
ncbi:MAG: glycosyltransferase [Betaproteobacteria bacterium]|nr:glycosyltransferase [Betaproteobacteria bacterium]